MQTMTTTLALFFLMMGMSEQLAHARHTLAYARAKATRK